MRSWKSFLDSQTLAQLQDDVGLSEAATAWCVGRKLRTLRHIRIAAQKPGGLHDLGELMPDVAAELQALLPTNAAAPRMLTNGLGARGSYAMLPGHVRTFLDRFFAPDFNDEELDRLIHSDLRFEMMRGCGPRALAILNEWRERMRVERAPLNPGRPIEHIRYWERKVG